MEGAVSEGCGVGRVEVVGVWIVKRVDSDCCGWGMA